MNPFSTAIARAGLDRTTTGDGAVLYLLLAAYGANYTGTYSGNQPVRESQRILKSAGLLDTFAGVQIAPTLEGLATRLDK